MRVLVQRCKNSFVKVSNKTVGKIDSGYVLFVGFTNGDSFEIVDKMVKKVLNLRIIDDENGIMNESILKHKKSILSISQFTLYADTKNGNRPSYSNALEGSKAIKLYEYFNNSLAKYVNVEKGIFGENMEVNLINDGPVTILLEV